jgi:hypothetical protein
MVCYPSPAKRLYYVTCFVFSCSRTNVVGVMQGTSATVPKTNEKLRLGRESIRQDLLEAARPSLTRKLV